MFHLGVWSLYVSSWVNCLLFDVMQTLEMLEKKEKVLQKKAAAEVEKAKEFTRAKNKKGKLSNCIHLIL